MRRRYELPDVPGRVDGWEAGLSRRVADAVRRGITAAARTHAEGHRSAGIDAGTAGGARTRSAGLVRAAFSGGRAQDLPSYDHQGQRAGVPVVQVSPPGSGSPGSGGPSWEGQISATDSAALRRRPFKDAQHPHDGTLADLPVGTRVTVSGQEHGWLRVQVGSGAAALSGYVSHELVSYVGPAPPAAPSGQLVLPDPASSAFSALHRAERRRRADPDWTPAPQERSTLEVYANILELDPRYTVDRQTYHVGFIPVAPITVITIEDFILFVETLEAQNPQASAGQIAGEVRQLWYSGNFELLLDSPGIQDDGKAVDIEDRRNPIAQLFDLPAMKTAAHQLTTRFGVVDIAHTIAGIDAVINGGSREPAQGDPKWKALHAADGGDPRDFATWAGDLGQAYAEFLESRYHSGATGQSLANSVRDKASDAQLLGDVHGYVAVEVWRQSGMFDLSDVVPGATVSEILRAFYLAPAAGPGDRAPTYRHRVEQVSGVSGDDLRALVRRRALAVARVFYVNAVVKRDLATAAAENVFSYLAGGETGVIDHLMDEFDEFHARNERDGASSDKLDTLVSQFMSLLERRGI